MLALRACDHFIELSPIVGGCFLTELKGGFAGLADGSIVKIQVAISFLIWAYKSENKLGRCDDCARLSLTGTLDSES
jgi:hypothetical protein